MFHKKKPENPDEKPKTKKKRKLKKILIGIAVLAVVLIAGFIIYAVHLRSGNTFFRNSVAKGIRIEGMTPKEAEQAILESYQDDSRKIVLNEKGKQVLAGSLSEYGVVFDEEKLLKNTEEALAGEKADLGSVFKTVIGENRIRIQIPYEIDETKFQNFVRSENLAVKRIQSTDAGLTYDKNQKKVVVQDAVEGNLLDDEKLQNAVREELEKKIADWDALADLTIEVPREAYLPVHVKKATEALQKEADALNAYVGSKITYTFGKEIQIVDFDQIMSWMDFSDGKASFNEKKMKEFVEKLAKKYNTRGRVRKFRTTGGKEITVDANRNSYGYRIDVNAEIEQLKKDIEAKKEISREPVYVKKNSYNNPYYLSRNGVDDLNGTYVEVDLTKQHFWFYKNGKLVVQSDVVTGDVTKGRGTITGVFPIAYKRQNTHLTGSTGEYNTPVSYWMPFYDGQGLHDAWWRGAFGGSIYKGNGSHGCVNLPKSAAKTLFDNVETGTAVILYQS